MTAVGWLPAGAEELFGTEATAEEAYDVLTVDVPPAAWISALETARDRLGCTYFDWLSAVDEPGTGFRVAAHVAALSPVRRLLLRTTVPHGSPVLPSAVAVYAGAGWHERETHEMFGVVFDGHPALDHLLLPESFEGHPLRKDFVLAARVAKAWPGAKEPGEPAAGHGGPKRRQMLPPGVPDPNEWGPLKGQLPPAPVRPARGAGRAAGAAGRAAGADRPARAAGDRAAGDRPVRRTRTASEGSAGQTAAGDDTSAPAPTTPRRARSASEGSASQRPAGPRRARSASEGSASQREPSPAQTPAAAPRSSDAPWHHARPAFDEPGTEPSPEKEPQGAEAQNEAPRDQEAQESQQSRVTQETQEAPEPQEAREAPEPEQPRGAQEPQEPQEAQKPQETQSPQDPQDPQGPQDRSGGTQ
ncbi:NADH-quinone oxidoreductase subunit C [Streptomyces sp. HMX87]|uniref:NADH-quinone oxidoreductase subunit C n=1 Tax=Streptomyces sp. HMX87 TaxID=3390849 RepID=UPI003A8A115D